MRSENLTPDVRLIFLHLLLAPSAVHFRKVTIEKEVKIAIKHMLAHQKSIKNYI